jgi:hypothetical protein
MTIQPREHAVPCIECRRRGTWNSDAVCDICKAEQLEARLAASLVSLGEFNRGAVLCRQLDQVRTSLDIPESWVPAHRGPDERPDDYDDDDDIGADDLTIDAHVEADQFARHESRAF